MEANRFSSEGVGSDGKVGRSTGLTKLFAFTVFGAFFMAGCSTMESTLDAINPFGESAPEAPAKPAPKTKSLEEAAKAAQESARPAAEGELAPAVPTTRPATDVAPAETALPKPGTLGLPDRVQPVEVMWRVPTDPVEKYYILYGTDESKLDKQVELSVKDIQKIDHPKFGPVFRYELRQVPIDKTLFISLKAENRFGVSAPTPPVRLEPGKRTVTP